jgi:hypothetical protein
LPSTGAATPKASSGPVDVQVSVDTEVCSCSATRGRATTKTVKVMLTDSSPASTVHNTHHWYRSDRATRWWMRWRNRTAHGTTIPPSAPAPVPLSMASASITSVSVAAPDPSAAPCPPGGDTVQPTSGCICACSSATVHRSFFSRVSVMVQGWNRRIWPPWTK